MIETWAEEGRSARGLGRESPVPSLHLCVVLEEALPAAEALQTLFERMRERSSRAQVRALGQEQGYRWEDAEAFVLAAPEGVQDEAERWLRRRAPRNASLRVLGRPGPWALAAVLRGRVGGAPERVRYERQSDGRIRLEAVEVHVAEHCNLRCANCCNMSPHVQERFLTVAELTEVCARLSAVVAADVLKVMGGEPLLHPQIDQMVEVMRRSGVGDRVRLFTNGLLLPAMSEPFWEGLDELTISSYSSAPVKPRTLDLAREKALRFGFVLNIKPVDEFSRVLSPTFERDDAVTRDTFSTCWLRHRCLIAREGKFFMCTRAAYAADFMRFVAHEAPPEGVPFDRSGDGIPLDAENLPKQLEAYLNREQPLGACRYCLGGGGAVEPHHQLSRQDVARGLLSRSPP